MRNIGFYRPYSPLKSPLRNHSPRHINYRNKFDLRQRQGNLSPFRRKNKCQENVAARSPSRTPKKEKISFLKIDKGREHYEFMESTIRQKRGLFQEVLKKKEAVEKGTRLQMINTQQNNMEKISEISQRKRGSAPEAMPNTTMGRSKFQTLLENVKEIESIDCSKEQNQINLIEEVKNEDKEKNLKKGDIFKIQEFFISSFGSQRPSEIVKEKEKTQQKENNEKQEKQNPQENNKVFEDSYSDLNMLLEKITQRKLYEKLAESEEQVKNSGGTEKQYDFSMSPFMN